MLDTLADLISKMIEGYKHDNFTLSLKRFKNPTKLLEKSQFLDHEIQCEINVIQNCWRGNIQIEQTYINYEFITNELSIKRARFFFNYTCLLCYILQRISKSERLLKITLVDYLGEKKLPSKPGKVLSSKHVNSGLTTFYKSENRADVLVYRREEMCKVLIHELLHAHDIDSKYISSSSESNISSLFCLDRLNINEAFTDAFACILNVILYTFFEKGDMSRLNMNMRREIDFIKSQAHKVISYTGYTGICVRPIKEETSVMSYYVVKSVILSNLDEYVRFILKHNLQFRDSVVMIAFINRLLKEPINWSTWGKKEYSNNIFFRSLRMSSFDLTNLVLERKVYKDKIIP